MEKKTIYIGFISLILYILTIMLFFQLIGYTQSLREHPQVFGVEVEVDIDLLDCKIMPSDLDEQLELFNREVFLHSAVVRIDGKDYFIGFVNHVRRVGNQVIANLQVDFRFLELISTGEIQFTLRKLVVYYQGGFFLIFSSAVGYNKEEFAKLKESNHTILRVIY